MNTLRIRPFAYFAAGVAVTVAAAWSLSAWRASAAVSADESTFVAVTPTRILDTRSDLGLAGPFVSADSQDLRVTGSIPVEGGGEAVVVPTGATGVMLNVTSVSAGANGFVSVRPADAPGVPSTSNLNFTAGDIIPNAVTVQVPTSGPDAGEIEITYNAYGQLGPTTEILVDVVGYTKNAGLASLQEQVNALQTKVDVLEGAGAQIVFDGDAAGGSLTGTYPNPGIGADKVAAANIAANAVGASEIADHSITANDLADSSVGLEAMNAVILKEQPFNTDTSVSDGTCSSDQPFAAAEAPAGSEVLVFLSRLADGSQNPGWTVQGGAPSGTPGTVNLIVCNQTDTPETDPPALRISFIVLGP